MTTKQAIAILDNAIVNAENNNLRFLTLDEQRFLYAMVKHYSNRKKEDAFGVAYAVNAMRPVYIGSDRQHAMEQFMKHIVTRGGFYRVAAFRTMQLLAQELGLTIDFPYPITRYTK